MRPGYRAGAAVSGLSSTAPVWLTLLVGFAKQLACAGEAAPLGWSRGARGAHRLLVVPGHNAILDIALGIMDDCDRTHHDRLGQKGAAAVRALLQRELAALLGPNTTERTVRSLRIPLRFRRQEVGSHDTKMLPSRVCCTLWSVRIRAGAPSPVLRLARRRGSNHSNNLLR